MSDGAPTSAQLKEDIDSGRGGDKVAILDPAAAPLGTDDEAAGRPPEPSRVQMAHDEEIRKAQVGRPERGSELEPQSTLMMMWPWIVIAAVGVAVAIALV